MSKKKKAQSRKPRAAHAVSISTPTPEEEAEIGEILIFERDDVQYTIPNRPNVGLALAYLRINAEEGENAGTYHLLVNALGKKGYKALETYPGLTKEILDQVVERAQTVIMGDLEIPKG